MDKWEYGGLTITRVRHEKPGGVFRQARISKRYVAELESGAGKSRGGPFDTYVDALNWAGARGWRATGDGEPRTADESLRQYGRPEKSRYFHVTRRTG